MARAYSTSTPTAVRALAQVTRGLVFVLAALLVAIPARSEAGLDEAVRNFPALIIGANIMPTDGTGPFARACPLGGYVRQSDGHVTRYLGASAENPALCSMQIDDQPFEAWYGIWHSDWPGADNAGIAFDRLIHGRTGQVEAFDVRVSSDFSFHEVLRNEGVETIRLAGRAYRALKLSHYRQGAEGNIYRSVVTGWKDMDSGMLLYVTYQHIAGVPEVLTPLLPVEIAPIP